ncbi:MAG: MotA/TolQ/ExbB proton channel family protein [Gammaproteobacteria bacterium]
MLEILIAGGWLMIPIVLCSVLGLAIVAERFWSLRADKITPPGLLTNTITALQQHKITPQVLRDLKENSPLGQIFAVALAHYRSDVHIIRHAVEDVGRHVVHQLERYLNMLGTIAAISPLLGLLGTVFGMIKVFSTITLEGVGNGNALAGGIAEALITTAAGLMVAIPAYIFYRYFERRVDDYAVELELQSKQLIDVMVQTSKENIHG